MPARNPLSTYTPIFTRRTGIPESRAASSEPPMATA